MASYADIALEVMAAEGLEYLWIGEHDHLLTIWRKRWPGRLDTHPGQQTRDVIKALAASPLFKRKGSILSVGLSDQERHHAVFAAA